MATLSPTHAAPASAAISRRTSSLVAAALLALMALLLIASVRQESPTFDEPVHLYAGWSYWKSGDFGRNPEHPPLAKLVAALPLLTMPLQQPNVSYPIPYFKALDVLGSSQFLYTADANNLLLRGRLMMVGFSLLLGLLVFLATRETFGELAALLALALFVLEPVLLANGPLITTDMPVACFFFAAVYAFYRFARRPGTARLAVCALACALAITVKHSGLLILPTLALLALLDLAVPLSILQESSPSGASAPRGSHSALWQRSRPVVYVFALLIILLTSFVALWTVYRFRYAARPGQLAIFPSLSTYAAGLSPLQHSILLFCARHHLLPEAYLYGWADILLIPGARSTVLFGHVFGTGPWYFLPALFLVKSTLFLLILLALIPLAHLGRQRRELLFFGVPPLVFLLSAVLSGVTIGLRHILPLYPFCVLLAGAAAASFALRSRVARYAVGAGLAFTLVSCLHCFPDFLAYSNEAFGGPSHTFRRGIDANDDWGQTLNWTRSYLDRHPSPDCWLTSTNFAIPAAYYGVHCKPLLSSIEHIIGIPSAGVLAPTLSGTFLLTPTNVEGWEWGPAELNPYAPFRDRQPDDMIGNAVLVYRGTFQLPLLAAQSEATLARALLQSGQAAKGVPLARAAAAQAPDSAEIHAVLAQTLLASGQAAAGQQEMATAIHLAQTIHPDYQRHLLHQLQHPLISSSPDAK